MANALPPGFSPVLPRPQLRVCAQIPRSRGFCLTLPGVDVAINGAPSGAEGDYPTDTTSYPSERTWK